METIQVVRGFNEIIRIRERISLKGVNPVVYENLDNVSAIYCRIRKDNRSDIVAKYSRDEKEGYIQLVRVDEYNYRLVIDSYLTRKLEIGTYYLGIAIHKENTDFEDNVFRGICETTILELVESKTDVGLE